VSSGRGGGILSTGTLTMTNSTVSGNSSAESGGIELEGQDPVSITSSTITGNSVGSHQRGGIGCYSCGPANINNSIVAGNIVATSNNPPTRIDIENNGPRWEGSHNLIGAGDNILGLNNLIGTPASPIDPRLGPLQDNGGPTETHALLTGSPAIDAADPINFPSTDQRGVARPQGAAPDIGAFEFDGTEDPLVLIELVIADVVALNLQQGLENSLEQKFTTAQSILDDLNENNDGAAVNKLQALINQVEAQRGNGLSDEDADDLIAATWIILELLGEEQP
jgi:hypothetical protein